MGKFRRNLLTRSLAFLAIIALLITSIQAPIMADEDGGDGYGMGLIIPPELQCDPLSHDFDYEHLVPEKDPTCTKPGKSIVYCRICGFADEIDKPDAIGHIKDSGSVTNPTCTQDGSIQYKCSVCGADMGTDTIPSPGHSRDDGTRVSEPDCTHDGTIEYHCTVCGNSIGSDSIPALGHVKDDGTVENEPTCTEVGRIKYRCARCGESMDSREIPALGHTSDAGTKESDPTCTEPGKIKYSCVRCGEDMGSQEIPALGHSSDAGTPVSEPTCTEAGKIQYKCVRCGKDMGTQDVPALGHVSDEGTAVKQVTCTEDGKIEFKCKRCGTVLDTKTVPALGHQSDAGTIVKHPTPTETGKIEYKCVNCGAVLKEETIPAIQRRDTPQAVFDTATCALSNIPEHSTVKVNEAVISPDATGAVSLLNLFPQIGEYRISVIANGNDKYAESEPQIIRTSKPKAPSNVQTAPEPATGGNGYINGVDTSMEYKLADQDSWLAISSSSQPASAGIYVVRYRATANSIPSDAVEALVMKKSNDKPATPNAVFDGPSHQLRGLAAGMVYSTNGGDTWTKVSETAVTLSEDAINQAVSYKCIWVKNVVDMVESDVNQVPILRITHPNGITSSPATSGNNGSINGVAPDMQYRKDGSSSWNDIGSNTVSGLSAGKYFVRRKASGYFVESNPVEIKVDDKTAKSAENKPTASFNAYNMHLDYVAGCKISFDGGDNWTNVIKDATYIVNEGDLRVSKGIILYRPGNGSTTSDSDRQYITLSKQPTPTGITATSATPLVPGSIKGTDSSMQYKGASQSGWTDITGNTVAVAAGTYYLRRHGYGNSLPSDWLTVVVNVSLTPQNTTPTNVVPIDNGKAKEEKKPDNKEEVKKDTKKEPVKEETKPVEEKPVEEEPVKEQPAIIVENNLLTDGKEPTLASGEKGWEAIEATFESVSEPVSVNLNEATLVPSEVFYRAAETDTQLVLTTQGNAVWSIDPADVNIEEVKSLQSVNLGIVEDPKSIPTNMLATVEDSSKNQVVNKTFDIKHDGNFGFKANLTMKIDNANPGEYANLYTYNSFDGKLEYITSSIINNKNEATFAMTHASSYVVVTSKVEMSQNDVKELKVEEVTKDEEVKPTTTNHSKKSSNPVVAGLIIIIIALIASLVVLLIYQKKSAAKKHHKK